MHRQAARAARGWGLGPAGLVGGGLQGAQMSRLVREQRGAELERVAPRGVRELVDDALHGERRVRVSHGAPPEHRHRRPRRMHGDQPRRHFLDVWRVGDALDRGGVHAVLDHELLERRPGQDRLADDGVLPCDGRSLAVETDLDPVQEERPVIATLDVILARPDSLHRHACRLGDVHRLADEVGGRRRAPSEAAAEELRMDRDVLLGDARDLGGRHLVHGLELGAGPDLAAAALELHRAVERLHRRVGKVRDVVLGHHALRGGRERRFRVPLLRGDAGSFGFRFLAVVLEKRCAVQRRARPQVPVDVDLQRVAPALGAPEVAGDHRQAGRDLHHLLHARDRFCLGRVERLDLAAEHGRARDQRGPQAGEAHVHAELRLPRHLLWRVEPAGGLAEQLPAFAILERHLLRRLLRLRGQGELPVGQPLLAVHDVAALGAQLLRVRLPPRRRRVDEHRTRHCPGGAVAVELRPGAGGPARHLHPERRVRVDRGGRRVLDVDLRPVAIQLLGDEHRQPGPDALSHLRVRQQHRHRVVWRHA